MSVTSKLRERIVSAQMVMYRREKIVGIVMNAATFRLFMREIEAISRNPESKYAPIKKVFFEDIPCFVCEGDDLDDMEFALALRMKKKRS